MTGDTKKFNSVSETSRKSKPDVSIMNDYCITEWEKKLGVIEGKEGKEGKIPPSICFSRKTGLDALKIANLLSEKTGYPVFEREIIEQMAENANLNKKTITFFDEYYPGKLTELAAFLFAEKSYVMSDYVKHLFRTVLSVADIKSSIFVGRGTHLILPVDRVLSVRLLSAKEYRCRNLAVDLNISETHAQEKLDDMDKEQMAFFKKVFHKKDAVPYEFDICINCDYIEEPQSIVNIVYAAFKEKFASEIK